jgi:4-diphosphocytidyl-2-C-methyl-D-erythritol kinase
VQIRRSANGIEVLAPAKVNLFFEVLGRRDDGFHEIESLMVPIGLYDTLILEDDPSGRISLVARWCFGFGHHHVAEQVSRPANLGQFGSLPEAEKNLAVRAVRLLAERAGVRRGAKLQLVKRIPAEAGLGGGSSDAAAGLLAANFAWKLGWSLDDLSAVAAELGSDVPFFLAGGTAVCRVRGERVQRVKGLPGLNFVLVRPPVGLATASVYNACRPSQSPKSVESVIQLLRKGNLGSIGPVAHNRLLEPARELSTWIDTVLDRLAAENCPVIGMSGSGTTCFALCRSEKQARQVAGRLRNRQPGIGRVWKVSSVTGDQGADE